jgi:acyl-homoserine-lactone acylase
MQITWDRWAVPTIVGEDDLDVVRGIGYAQAVAVANDVLEMYGLARGKAASYWGPDFLHEDRFTATMGLGAKTDEWLANQLPETLERIAAFCDGFNEACVEDERRGGDRREVLPIAPRDVIAHLVRIFVRFNQIDGEMLAFDPKDFYGARLAGSSSWAIAGTKSTTGNAMVMANPHLSWSLKYHRFVELRTVSPGRDFHGVTLIGAPWQAMGFSPHVAWTHTVNPIRNMVAYSLDVSDGSYRFGDGSRELQTVEHTLEVRGGEPVVVTERRSVHGPVVVAPDGTDVAVRIAGVLDEPAYHALESWWQLSLATSVKELFSTHDRVWLPMYTITAGDASGSIGALFCGTPPVRQSWDEVKVRQDGSDPASASFAVHPASAMPRVLDPECGWVNNCNETPFLFSDPPLDPADYPPAIAPGPFDVAEMRPFVSRDWLKRHETVSPEQLLELKLSKRAVLADLVLDQLLEAAEGVDGLEEAVRVLRAWDRTMTHDSKGYVLAYLWTALITPARALDQKLFVPREQPGELPRELADPADAVTFLQAAVAVLALGGVPLDAAMGDIATYGRPDNPLRADGASGLLGGLKCLEVLPTLNGFEIVVADTWVSRIQMRADGPPLAESLLVYGNTTDPAAPPSDDQYALWHADQLRPRD